LYSPPKIRQRKFGYAGYQPHFNEELAAEKILAKIRLISHKLLKKPSAELSAKHF